MAHATTLGLGGAPRRDRIGGSASFICLITERASARSAAVGLEPGEPPGSWLELEALSFIRGSVRARTRRPPSVELRRPLSQGSMAHHGWGALTGRQREQSAVATVSASSESWEAGWSDALDTRPERVVSPPGFVRKEELIADLTATTTPFPVRGRIT